MLLTRVKYIAALVVSEPESEKLLAGVWQSVVSLTPKFHLLRKLFPRDILIDALDN